MKVVVGAPSLKRDWILPYWYNAIKAAIHPDWDTKIVVSLPEADVESIKILEGYDDVRLDLTTEEMRDEVRDWNNHHTLSHLAAVRNRLLTLVREEEPDIFVSVDTDIIIHPESLMNMCETYDLMGADAVAGLTYLSATDINFPNYGYWTNGYQGYRRGKPYGVSPVDIIMAYKMMGPKAYSIDYAFHHFGEDLGWSKQAHESGLVMYADARVANKHVMSPHFLEVEDRRCGY